MDLYIRPFAELIIRYFYFGLKFERLFKRNNQKKKPSVQKVTIDQIEKKMKEFGIEKGDTLMVHSSFKFVDDTAEKFIDFLINYIGQEGNILMPTHPELHEENGIPVYDLLKSPSTVGILTEIFRKTNNVSRSMHPFSSVAVWGKDKEYLLENNLNKNKPLPHGIASPYYKMTKLNAKILFVGVSARGRATIRHVAEEVLDHRYPTKDLFKEHEIIIKNDGEFIDKVKVRSLNLDKSKIFIAKFKIVKEWVDNEILIKSSINSLPIEFISSGKCVDYMVNQAKKGNTCYPYAATKKN